MAFARALVVLCAVLAAPGSGRRLRADPPAQEVSDTLARLQPVLDKVRNLDPKSFGALSGMMNQVKPSSFIQFVKDDPQDVQETLAALGPVLDKLRNLDPKSFGALSGMMNQVQPGKASLIQIKDAPAKDENVDVPGTVDRLQPVLDKLRNLDPKIFGAMSSMIDKAQQDNQK